MSENRDNEAAQHRMRRTSAGSDNDLSIAYGLAKQIQLKPLNQK